jgi:uracil-DNA glycosylase
MLEAANPVQSEMIVSALDWWALAGVDTLVDEVATPWIERGKRAPPVSKAEAASIATPAETLPKTLPELADWLKATPSLDMIAPSEQRLAPSGNAEAALMIMIDMPERGDADADRLLHGEVGELFDNMLKAIDQSRETVWLSCFSPGRPPGGQLNEAAIAQLTPVARHHVALVRPKRLWLMGQAVSRALGGADAVPGAGRKPYLNHDGANVELVASFSPGFLLANPKRKKAAWADMQALVEGIEA